LDARSANAVHLPGDLHHVYQTAFGCRCVDLSLLLSETLGLQSRPPAVLSEADRREGIVSVYTDSAEDVRAMIVLMLPPLRLPRTQARI
jgi:hypothetical protein